MRNIFLILLLYGSVAFAQFGYDKYDDDPQAKHFEFWSQSYFNRVEGIVPHVGIAYQPTLNKSLKLLGGCAYGIESEKWQYSGELEKQFFAQNRLLFRAGIFRETATNENWMIGQLENSLAGLFLHEDFRDYFGKEGFRIVFDKQVKFQHFVRLTYENYKYQDMAKSSDYASSILGNSKTYRPNPGIVEGDEQKFKLSVLLDWRDNVYFPHKGFYLEGIFEKTFGDFKTHGMFFDTRYYLPTFYEQKIIFRTLFGVRKGSLASQHISKLGGIGGLVGFPDHYSQGQNLLYWKIYYDFGGQIIQTLPLGWVPSIESTMMGLFIEGGDAWCLKQKSSLFDDLNSVDWMYDAGVSLQLIDGLVRLDFARPLNTSIDDWRITFRIFNKL